MSKALKKLKRLLTDHERAFLCCVSIPATMAFEETKDLMDACRRLGINVPILFLNMLSPASECSFCSAAGQKELERIREFRQAFPEQHIVSVYRQEDPCGVERLKELGMALYKD